MVLETMKGLAKVGSDTVRDVVGKPFVMPIDLIEGKGMKSIGETTRGAIGSILSLPFRVLRDGGSGLAADLWNLVKGGGKLALHLPFIPQWRQERQNVMLATQGNLGVLKSKIDHMQAV